MLIVNRRCASASILWWLSCPFKILAQFIRLALFAGVLLTGFIPIFILYLYSRHVVKGIRYGKGFRQKLDIYHPMQWDGDSLSQPPEGFPVCVFVCGGAWIIGHRTWAFLMGYVAQRNGVLFLSVDYRNYPCARVPAMADDVEHALTWVLSNIRSHGGNPSNVTLIGQSAGAHLTALVLLRQAKRMRDGICADPSSEICLQLGENDWTPCVVLRRWIGVSGLYNVPKAIPEMSRRGLPECTIQALFDNDAIACSPTYACIDSSLARLLPPVYLFHGRADKTASVEHSEEFAATLRSIGAHVESTYYDEFGHTDPILEGPLSGTDPLMAALLSLIHGEPSLDKEVRVPMLVPPCLVRCARWVNPF